MGSFRMQSWWFPCPYLLFQGNGLTFSFKCHRLMSCTTLTEPHRDTRDKVHYNNTIVIHFKAACTRIAASVSTLKLSVYPQCIAYSVHKSRFTLQSREGCVMFTNPRCVCMTMYLQGILLSID